MNLQNRIDAAGGFTNKSALMTRQCSPTDRAKETLARKGYSQRQAAPLLDVSPEHLNRVLNGHRESARLLAAIEELPERKEAAGV